MLRTDIVNTAIQTLATSSFRLCQTPCHMQAKLPIRCLLTVFYKSYNRSLLMQALTASLRQFYCTTAFRTANDGHSTLTCHWRLVRLNCEC